ncbi:hypothetical protein [Marinibactrum halimedae]|uniref:Uncharacterized protein n=1 Tax=Marinibactrum halimedae TaxID=1444977 RepID=A0AA37WMR7_9GAMM|nr:hypothetical protein [Marinibactrum halimedae]MCD9460280.1 hypothetical protein [Marinibactrum halimedae]GLS24367.1 hypothetical protein GCM10007877_00780 [Marinibactrum halimedae]
MANVVTIPITLSTGSDVEKLLDNPQAIFRIESISIASEVRAAFGGIRPAFSVLVADEPNSETLDMAGTSEDGTRLEPVSLSDINMPTMGMAPTAAIESVSLQNASIAQDTSKEQLSRSLDFEPISDPIFIPPTPAPNPPEFIDEIPITPAPIDEPDPILPPTPAPPIEQPDPIIPPTPPPPPPTPGPSVSQQVVRYSAAGVMQTREGETTILIAADKNSEGSIFSNEVLRVLYIDVEMRRVTNTYSHTESYSNNELTAFYRIELDMDEMSYRQNYEHGKIITFALQLKQHFNATLFVLPCSAVDR